MRQGVVNLAIAALVAVVAGSIALVLCTQAHADEISVDWTWEVYPTDRVNTEALERIRHENAAKAFGSTVDMVAVSASESLADAAASIVDYFTPEPYVEPVYYEPAYYAPSYDMPTDGLTKSGGVNYHDGRTETYYSSQVLYHKDTASWTLDSEGFYRTSEGQYVVAASDMPQGTVFEGSKGECIVLDTGCAAGTTDYYVAW